MGYRALLVATLALVAACDAGYVEPYPDELVENFLTACAKESSAATCRCAVDRLQRRFTLAEYRELEREMRKGTLPKVAADTVADCRR